MRNALDQFKQNLARARSLVGLSVSMSNMTTPALDTTDLLRASLVLVVSALDHFVHEFTRLGMLEIYARARPETPAYREFKVPLSAVQQAVSDDRSADWLDQKIRKAHGWISFQFPDRIADAIRLVSTVKLWETVALERGEDVTATKAALGTIVDRRNKIAHEADIDPTSSGERWPIDAGVVEEAIDCVESIVHAIYRVAGPGVTTAAGPTSTPTADSSAATALRGPP